MPEQDALLATIEAVHAAGLDEDSWPTALASVSRLFGAAGTTFEVVDKPAKRLSDFWGHGVSAASELEYAEHFLAMSPRVALGLAQRSGDIAYDYMLIDEAALGRNPFYADFLGRLGLRYFISGVIRQSAQEFACIAVQRSPRQGHVGEREIALMRTLIPHLRIAFDVTRRLRTADCAAGAIEQTLDWLADGAALVRGDGHVVFVNAALRAVACRGDGIRIARERLEFAAVAAGNRYAVALTAAAQIGSGATHMDGATDFAVARASDAPPYLVSIRPLPRAGERQGDARADAIVFVRDPLQDNRSSIALLREVFGFTPAEAGIAQALQAGIPLAEHARRSALSLNTAYMHLRRIKEKTGTRRQVELIRKLTDVMLPLRGL